MPYIAYLFHLLIIPTRATGNPELEAALLYQQIYLETVLGQPNWERHKPKITSHPRKLRSKQRLFSEAITPRHHPRGPTPTGAYLVQPVAPALPPPAARRRYGKP